MKMRQMQLPCPRCEEPLLFDLLSDSVLPLPDQGGE